jgi:hypothetical protein
MSRGEGGPPYSGRPTLAVAALGLALLLVLQNMHVVTLPMLVWEAQVPLVHFSLDVVDPNVASLLLKTL